MKPKIKPKTDVRSLIEQAILIARLQNASQGDLEASIHLIETQTFSLKTAKAVDGGLLKNLSIKL